MNWTSEILKLKILNPKEFKDSILSFIKTKENLVFVVYDAVGLKLLTRLRLGFSHLNKQK